MKPLAIDLFCGLGGWAHGFLAEGFRVVGFDIEPLPYPGQLVLQDVRTLTGRQFRSATVIVASPPCTEFSRLDQPWSWHRPTGSPDLSLVQHCYRIAREAGVPLVLENVRGAAPYLGPPVARYGYRYLWGDGVPALIPYAKRYRKGDPGSKSHGSSCRRRERAVIPLELASFLARCYGGTL